MTASISSRKPIRLLCAVAVATAFLLGLSGTAQASPEAKRMAATPYYELRPLHNRNMCLDVAHASVAHGADVIQGTCWGGANQFWTLVGVGDDYYQLRPLSNTRMCLDVAHVSTAHGANVIQGNCAQTGGTNQHWKVLVDVPGYHEVRARHSDMCLDVAHQSVVHGADVVQGNCWFGANQRWELRYAGHF